MSYTILATAAIVGRLSRTDTVRFAFAITFLLAPSAFYNASPRWAQRHVWVPVWGIHTGHRAAPKQAKTSVSVTRPEPLAIEPAREVIA